MPRIPVHIRLLAGLLAVALVPLSVLAVFFLLTFERALTSTVVSTVSSVADNNLEVIEAYISERIQDVQIYSRLDAVRERLQAPRHIRADQSFSADDASLLDDFFEDVLLIDPQGTILWSRLGAGEVGLNVNHTPLLHAPLLAGWRSAVESLHTDITQFAPYALLRDDVQAFIVGPVMRGSQLLGVVAARVPLRQLLPVFQDRTGLGQTGEILVTMRVADSLVYLSALPRLGRNELYRIAMRDAAIPMQNAHIGQKGSGIEEDYAGIRVVASWSYLPSLSWGMVVKIDTEEAFVEAQTVRTLTLVVFLTLLLVTTLFGLLLYRWSTQKERDLEARTMQLEEAQRIARIGSWTYDVSRKVFVGSYQTHALFNLEYEPDGYPLSVILQLIHKSDFSRGRQFVKLVRGDIDTLDETQRLDTQIFGESNYIRIRGEVQRDAQGRILTIAGTVQDVTKSRTSEMALRALNEHLASARDEAERLAAEAETANKAKSDFLANVSHEIRTPLNGILGITQLLLDYPLPAEQKQYVEIVSNSGDVLLSLINNLLDVSKIEAGKVEIDETDFQLPRLLEEVMISLSRISPSPEVQVYYHVDEIVPDWVVSDPVRIRQIMVNLIGNALKFTEKGEIEVRLSGEQRTEELFEVRLMVRDTGIGIPEDKFHLLFSKFTQADTSTTRKYGGTGLGLAISKKLISLLGGDITVESRLGEGSTFMATIGVKRSRMENVRPEPFPEAPRVLVLCAHPGISATVADYLVRWNALPVVQSLNDVQEGLTGIQAVVVWQEASLPDPVQLSEAAGMGLPVIGVRDTPVVSSVSDQKVENVTFLNRPLQWNLLHGALQVALNLASKEATSPQASRTPSLGLTQNLSVLLVEDHPVNRQVAHALLTRLGHRVSVASNGKEALEVLSSQAFDLVLMDVQMPVMDGLQATSAIRSGATLQPQIPVIACTAHAMEADRVRCFAAGMNDYITKPLDAQILELAVGRLVGKRETHVTHPVPAKSDRPPDGVFCLEDVRRRLEDDALVCLVFEAFLEDAPRLLQALKVAHDIDDIDVVRRELHTLKGLAATVGGDYLARRAGFWEKHEALTETHHREMMLVDVQQEYDALCKALHGALPL